MNVLSSPSCLPDRVDDYNVRLLSLLVREPEFISVSGRKLQTNKKTVLVAMETGRTSPSCHLVDRAVNLPCVLKLHWCVSAWTQSFLNRTGFISTGSQRRLLQVSVVTMLCVLNIAVCHLEPRRHVIHKQYTSSTAQIKLKHTTLPLLNCFLYKYLHF